jgi:hypothetical protein
MAEHSGFEQPVRISILTSGEQVKVIRFDDYWNSELHEKVRLTKIDVEGEKV